MVYYAHSFPDQPKEHWQLLQEHLCSVAKLAAEFGDLFDSKEIAYQLGLLHDVGKYSIEFQNRLAGSGERVDHATAGSQEAIKFFGEDFFGIIMAYVITGHHGGLLDYGSQVSNGLKNRLSKKEIPRYSDYENDIKISPDAVLNKKLNLYFSENRGFFTLSLYIRMLFSCLVDADFLDTERVLNPQKSILRGKNINWQQLDRAFSDYCKGFSKVHVLPINQKRQEIFNQCKTAAALEQGLFTLTAPTGSGKTIASIAFALEHLKKHCLNRIVYVIPYTSIIEQNAQIMRNIFGDENVLEHHSNFESEKVFGDDILAVDKMKLAAENWDMPMIATTNVQFFQSLFAGKVSSCRKLHNLVGSIIILDEAQMLPTEYLKPCLAALVELVKNYHCTVVLCTATQPKIINYLPTDLSYTEIIADPIKYYIDFKRTKAEYLGRINDDDLVDRLVFLDQALVIVNTRKHAQNLYNKLKKCFPQEVIFHLSAKMYPKHRKKILVGIEEKLKANKPCLVISTQLIEAGVDIDFPVVFRSLAGIDSIAQAAGRCNREGKLDRGKVYVFESAEDYGKAYGWQSVAAAHAKEIIEMYADDFLSLAAIDKYFELLYSLAEQSRIDGLDKYQILQLLGSDNRENPLYFSFAEAADRFKIIRQDTISLVIPDDEECRDLIHNAKNSKFPKSFSRKLQPYTINIYEQEFKCLQDICAVEIVGDIFWVLKDCQCWYSNEVGLKDVCKNLIENYIQ